MIRALSRLPDAVLSARTDIEEPAGFGALETARGSLPLVAMDVVARVAGLTSHVTVRQTFRNALSEPLEATYIFPLPDRAAVTSFRMRVADRVLDGQLKERSKARADYQQAVRDGHRAAIAEEERSGTFSLRVGNIPAKEEVSVELTLVGPVPVSAGEATFRFPLLVAPRYVPGVPLDGPSVGAGWASDTDAVPDASRVTPPVLLPGYPNPVRLSLAVELDSAGLDAADADWIDRIGSSLHSVITEDGPPWTVRLQPGARLNRDFILRFPVTAATVQTTLQCTAADDDAGTFALTLVPPAITAGSRPAARDVVVVLDRSGSMSGWKMVAARRAVGRMIDTLLDQDRFTVLAFDNEIEQPPHTKQTLTHATDRGRWRALEWLGRIDARGGTEMGLALQEAAQILAADDAGRQRIVILVTDGQVAGEDAVLRSLKDSTGSAVPRIHTLGIDRAVNIGFLRRLADFGGGVCDVVESEDRLDVAMDHIHRAIGAAVLTQLQLDPIGGTWDTGSLAPSRLPDLFADRPVTVFGRCRGDTSSLGVRIRATDAAGRPWQHEVSARPGPAVALRSLWGRAKVRELEDRYAAGDTHDPRALERQIVEVSLSAHVLSRFTAYVAVDCSEVVNKGGRQEQLVQPVEAPDGWGMFAEETLRTLTEAPSVESLRYCRSAVGKTAAGGAVFNAVFCRVGIDSQPSAAQPPPPSRAARRLEEVVAEIRELLKKLDAPRRQRLSQRRANVEQLAKLLGELAALLRCQQKAAAIAAARAIEQVAENASDLLDDYGAGNKRALGPKQLGGLTAKAREALDGIEQQSGSEAERQRFWT